MFSKIDVYSCGDVLFFKAVTDQNTMMKSTISNILLCDTSGSMVGYWSDVAESWNKFVATIDGTVTILLFDDIVTKIKGKTLPRYQIRRGGTNIIGALNSLNKEIYSINNSTDIIRIFFITDGGDGNDNFEERFNKCLSDINRPYGICEFYVLGISESFPAFISQNLRASFHNGRSNIPSIFWSEDGTPDQISSQFDSLSKYNVIRQFDFPFGGKNFPFSEIESSFFLGDYILFENNIEYNIKTLENFEILIELFQQWVGIIQTRDINNNVVKDANILKGTMENLWNTFINKNKVNFNMKTFSERIANKKLKTFQLQYTTLLKIVNDLASGIKLKMMNNLDLAKQLNSVYTGKYSQVNFKMREHTDTDFIRDRDDFIKIFRDLQEQLKDINSSEEGNCLITLDNTIEILKSEDFLTTLESTDNKVDFLKSFGVTGHGVLLNITDASTINPWVTQVKDVPKFCSVISTTAIEEILETEGNSDNFVVSVKINTETSEKLNSIIPLFSEKVSKIVAPIVRSNIFQLICTYSILKSPITINYYAHIGAISSLFAYLLSQPYSQ